MSVKFELSPYSRFIAIEGIDGSGKSTVAHYLQEWVEEQTGERCILLQQPGTTVVGLEVRKLIKEKGIRPQVQHLLLEAARYDLMLHMEEIRKLFEKNKQHVWFITDRHELSTEVYQSVLGIDSNYIGSVNQYLAEFLEPDLTIYLNVSVNTAMARVASRGGTGSDFFDSQNKSFFRRCKSRYDDIFRNSDDVLKVDANKPLEKVLDFIKSHLVFVDL